MNFPAEILSSRGFSNIFQLVMLDCAMVIDYSCRIFHEQIPKKMPGQQLSMVSQIHWDSPGRPTTRA
jgi:hypothetical protein